jgi:hypothetical protein
MEGSSGGDAVYGMGLIGALIYFLQHASSFSEGVLGILKAIAWPGVLVFRVLELLKV